MISRRFPFKRPEVLKKWILAIKRKDFVPKSHHYVCSVHFKQEDYQHSPASYRKMLKEFSVPSIFPSYPEYYQPKSKKIRTSKTSVAAAASFQAVASTSKCQEDATLMPAVLTEELDEGGHLLLTSDKYTQTNAKVVAEKGCQTSSMTLPKTSAFYRRKIRMLNQKLRRRDKKVENLDQLVKQLKKVGLVQDPLEQVLLDNFEGMSLELFKNIKKNRSRNRKGHRYSQELKKFALTLYYNSPKAYKYCRLVSRNNNFIELVSNLRTRLYFFRDILQLPDPSSLGNWISNVDAEPGFFKNVFKCLESFKSKDCNLVMDAMAIRKQIIWNEAEKKMVGYVDYGEHIHFSKDDEPASEVLVFMLVCIKESWKWPIGYFCQNKSTASIQESLIRSAVQLSCAAGLKVRGITFDGTVTNFATARALGCETRGDLENLKTQCIIGNEIIYAIPDACHMLKLSRNCIGTLKVLKSPYGTINWSFVTKLHELQSRLGFKFANKLSRTHVNWSLNTMKVKLAAQTLSSSTATALEFLEQSGVEEFKGAGPTIQFIKIIDNIFDFLNSRNPLGKGFKSPLTLANIERWENKLENALEYLFSLKTYDNTLLFKSSRKTFINGFAMAIKSVIAIAKSLLSDKDHFKYLLTYKFSQDHLESFFSKLRARHGFNNNPNIVQLKYAFKQILLKNQITASPSGNSLLIDKDPAGNIFEIEWNRKKKYEICSNEDEGTGSNTNEEEVDDFTMHCLADNEFNLQDNILYYISGYIIRKIFPKVGCCTCRESLLWQQTEHSYASPGKFANFTILKNNGGLVRASKSVLLVVKTAEQVLGAVTQQYNLHMLSAKTHDEVLHKTKYTLAKSNAISFCGISESLNNHKIEIIKFIASQYLKIRLFALSKLKTHEINKISRRHHFTKMILFNNQ